MIVVNIHIMNMNFIRFKDFLLEHISEANAFGSEFEQYIADNIQEWINYNKLNKKFQVERYQTLTEFDGNRDEDYSDIIIKDLSNDKQIFIECKKTLSDNISQVMIDFKESSDGRIVPLVVKGSNRINSNIPVYKAFEQFILKNDEFKKFLEFFNNSVLIDGIKFYPKNLYFNKYEIEDAKLNILIDKYNQLIDKNLLNSKNKKFNKELIRSTTRNMLACGLLWRLVDIKHTWDICHLNLNGSGFSKMICMHYLKEKAIPVNYIQFGEDLLFRFSEENPLNIECSIFPENVIGKFDLKFTPRFGTGSMYITSRSKIVEKLESNTSFGSDKNKWPKIKTPE